MLSRKIKQDTLRIAKLAKPQFEFWKVDVGVDCVYINIDWGGC